MSLFISANIGHCTHGYHLVTSMKKAKFVCRSSGHGLVTRMKSGALLGHRCCKRLFQYKAWSWSKNRTSHFCLINIYTKSSENGLDGFVNRHMRNLEAHRRALSIGTLFKDIAAYTILTMLSIQPSVQRKGLRFVTRIRTESTRNPAGWPRG